MDRNSRARRAKVPGSPEARAAGAESNVMSASTTTTMASSTMSASPPVSAPGSEREDDDHQVQHQQRQTEEVLPNQTQQHQSAQALSPAASPSNDTNSGGESRMRYNSSAAHYSLPQHLLGMGISVGVPADDVVNTGPGMNSSTKASPLSSVPNSRPKVFSRDQSQPDIYAYEDGDKAQTKPSSSKPSNSSPKRARSPKKISPLKKPSTSPTVMNRQTSQASSNSSSSHQASAQATRMTESLQRQSSTNMADRLNRLRSAASNRNTKNNGGMRGPVRRSKSDVTRLQSNRNENSGQEDEDQVGKSKQDYKKRSFSSSPIARYQQQARQTGKDELGRISERPNIELRRSLTNPIPQNRRQLRRHSANLTDVQEEGEDDDVLMLIAKARAKLEMEGEDNEAAAAVLAQLEQQQQQQQHQQQHEGRENLEQQKASGLGSIGTRSVTSSLNGGSQGGVASLPGAYEKVPGGKFEKKDNFTHESITRYSESAQMRTPLSNRSFQQQATGGFVNSDLDSISSGESANGVMSDIMEIEFSQQSFSNHHGDDDGKGDKKPAALDGVAGGGSVCASLATQSINPDDLFLERNESGLPAARKPTRGDDGRAPGNNDDNYARIPSASLAPSTISDDESDDSSYRRRRRQRHRRSDDRRSSGGGGKVSSKKNASKPMKDTSAESEASQLVIAAEVVRSEEEMVTELRQKVEKEILESMAEELIKMEASQSAFSSAEMEMSTLDPVGKASPKTRRGSTRGKRRASLNRGQPQQVPPSPMAISMQAGRARQQKVTPSQNRGLNLRGLNLSGFTSPAFLRGTSRGRSKQKMPQLGQASFDSSSDSDDGNAIRRNHSEDPRNVVDAVEVIPASPLQRRAVSQPLPRFQPAAVHARQQTVNATNSPMSSRRTGDEWCSYDNGGTGTAQTSALISQLSQLRSLSTAASTVPNIATDTPERRESNTSLPDIVTPPSLRNNTSASGESSVPSGRQASMSRSSRRPSTCASVQEDPQPAAPFQQQHSHGMPLYDSDGMDESLQFRRASAGNGHHGDALNTHTPSNTRNLNNNTMENSDRIPSDWDLHQMEMAEMGCLSRHGSETTLSLARQQSAARRNSGVLVSMNDGGAAGGGANDEWEEPMITYDDRLPASWVTPVGVLVVGAVVLGLVLFAF